MQRRLLSTDRIDSESIPSRSGRADASYTLEYEIEGVLRAANEAGFERFHLVGYSAGGASSLAFAASRPDRLLSLALIEPAWLGNEGLSPKEQAVHRHATQTVEVEGR